MPCSTRSLLSVGLGVGVLVTVASGAGLAGADGTPILAWHGGEVWGHLWTWWWHGRALPAWPAGTDLVPGADSWPVIDLLPALMGAGLSRLVGVVAAYDLVTLAAIAGAYAGGWFAARRVGGVGWVGGGVLALGPVFRGSVASGLTEDLAVGGLAVVAGLLARPPAPEARPWRWSVGLGLLLGALVACGFYLAWLGAVLALAWGLRHMLASPRRMGPWVLAAAVAATVAVAVAWPQGDRLLGEGHRFGTRLEQVEPLWPLNPWGGADLASFLVPGGVDIPDDAVVRLHPVYLGFSVLLLALAAGRTGWWGVLVAALLLAPGASLYWTGRPLHVANPAVWLLQHLPGGALVNHHARLFLGGQVALAMLAGRGAWRLRVPGRVLGAVALLELYLLSPLPGPLPVADASAPDHLRSVEGLSEGALLPVPLAGPGIHPQRPLAEQRFHGRPLPIHPNRPGPPSWLAREETGRWLATLALPRAAPRPASPDPCPWVARGVAILDVRPPWVASVEEALGTPDVRGRDGALWDLAVRCEEGAEARAGPTGAPESVRVPEETSGSRGE